MTERATRAGRLQIGSMMVFCLAALLGCFAFHIGSYFFAAVNAALMGVTFYLYQVNSRIIQSEAMRKTY